MTKLKPRQRPRLRRRRRRSSERPICPGRDRLRDAHGCPAVRRGPVEPRAAAHLGLGARREPRPGCGDSEGPGGRAGAALRRRARIRAGAARGRRGRDPPGRARAQPRRPRGRPRSRRDRVAVLQSRARRERGFPARAHDDGAAARVGGRAPQAGAPAAAALLGAYRDCRRCSAARVHGRGGRHGAPAAPRAGGCHRGRAAPGSGRRGHPRRRHPRRRRRHRRRPPRSRAAATITPPTSHAPRAPRRRMLPRARTRR